MARLSHDDRRLLACAPEEERHAIQTLLVDLRAAHAEYRAWRELKVRDPNKCDPAWLLLPQPCRNLTVEELQKQSVVQHLNWAHTWAGLTNLPDSKRARIDWHRRLHEEKGRERCAEVKRRLKEEAQAQREARRKEEKAKRRREARKPEFGVRQTEWETPTGKVYYNPRASASGYEETYNPDCI